MGAIVKHNLPDMDTTLNKTRICSLCGKELLTDFFYRSWRRCKTCINSKAKERKLQYKLRTAIIIPEIKLCPSCQQVQPGSLFNKNSSSKDGLGGWCRVCKGVDRHKKEEEYGDREEIDIPETKRCPKCSLTLSNKYFAKSKIRKDGLSSVCKLCMGKTGSEWAKNHRAKINLRVLNKRRSDPVTNLLNNLRRRVLLILDGTQKSAHTIELLCCSGKEWKEYLSLLFWPGMIWKEYGKTWEIDHIVPCIEFPLTSPEGQKAAFNYKNTQPLWKDDNRKKNRRLDWTPQESKHPLPDRLKTTTTEKNRPVFPSSL